MNSKILVGSLVAVAAGAVFVTTGVVSAHSGLGQNLADEQKVTKMEERKVQMQESLSNAVSEGAITAEQKTILDAKLAAMHDKRLELQNSDATRDEVRDATKTLRDDIKSWADNNNIELGDILPQGPEGHERGQGRGQEQGQHGHQNQ